MSHRSPEFRPQGQAEQVPPLEGMQEPLGEEEVLENMIPADGPFRIKCGNLNFDLTQEALAAHFSPLGKLVDVFLPKRSDGRATGSGFVEFENREAMKRAMLELDGGTLAGRELKIDVAPPRSDRRGGGRGGRGGRGGKSSGGRGGHRDGGHREGGSHKQGGGGGKGDSFRAFGGKAGGRRGEEDHEGKPDAFSRWNMEKKSAGHGNSAFGGGKRDKRAEHDGEEAPAAEGPPRERKPLVLQKPTVKPASEPVAPGLHEGDRSLFGNVRPVDHEAFERRKQQERAEREKTAEKPTSPKGRGGDGGNKRGGGAGARGRGGSKRGGGGAGGNSGKRGGKRGAGGRAEAGEAQAEDLRVKTAPAPRQVTAEQEQRARKPDPAKQNAFAALGGSDSDSDE